jgi:hypothetical protein
MMRVKPSVPVGIGLAVGYMALFGGLFALSGVDYDDLSNSADNALKAIVIPLSVAAVVLVIVTSVLSWWKPVLRETTRVRGWLVVVPILMVVQRWVASITEDLGTLIPSSCSGLWSEHCLSGSVRNSCTGDLSLSDSGVGCEKPLLGSGPQLLSVYSTASNSSLAKTCSRRSSRP